MSLLLGSIKRKRGTSKLQQCSLWCFVVFMGLLCLTAKGLFTLPHFFLQHPLCVPIYCKILRSVNLLLMLFRNYSFNLCRLRVGKRAFDVCVPYCHFFFSWCFSVVNLLLHFWQCSWSNWTDGLYCRFVLVFQKANTYTFPGEHSNKFQFLLVPEIALNFNDIYAILCIESSLWYPGFLIPGC